MITELDDKYIVVKCVDVYNYLRHQDLEQIFNKCLNSIGNGRVYDNKAFTNKYVVLKLEAELDLNFLTSQLERLLVNDTNVKVKDIAVDLVNAILTAKGD